MVAAGQYGGGSRFGDHHLEFMRESESLEVRTDGRYRYEYQFSEYGRVEVDRYAEGRWYPTSEGIRLSGNIQVEVATVRRAGESRFVLLAEGGRVYLLGHRRLRRWCEGSTTGASLDGVLGRAATEADGTIPSFQTICARL
jgi:hypothetical protein